MSKLKVRQITGIAVLTAMYCVLSAFLKVPFIGNIMLDLGYIALVVGCVRYGMWGAAIGAIGCGLESILFTAYGFSISWFVANLIIGLGCGYVFQKTTSLWKRIVTIILFCAIGLIGAKTVIECYLYNIPFAIKVVKNLVAFGADCAVMIIGLIGFNTIKHIK